MCLGLMAADRSWLNSMTPHFIERGQWFSKFQQLSMIQCGAIIRWWIFLYFSQQTPHSSPVRAKLGVSFIHLKSDPCSVSITALLYLMILNIWSCYVKCEGVACMYYPKNYPKYALWLYAKMIFPKVYFFELMITCMGLHLWLCHNFTPVCKMSSIFHIT